MKLENGQNLQDHLKMFVELFEELVIIGDAIVEEKRVIILLSSLPDRFSTLVPALEANEKILAWEVVTERLLNEERRQRGGPGTSDSSEKLLVSFKRNKNLIKCFECGKEGHIKRQCRVFEERLRKENRTFQANKAVDARSSSTGETIMFTSAFPIFNVDCDSWIVDSDATQHIGTKGYKLYDFNTKRILLSRDVVFNEFQFMSFEKEPSKEIDCVPWSFPQEEKREDSEGELELRRSTRNRAAPDRFGEWVCFAQDKFDVPRATKNEVFLEQSAYTKALLSRFGMDKANSVATPVDVNADLVTTSDEVEECDEDLYQSAVAGAAQEAIWLKHFLDDLEFKTGGPMVVNEDNQSAICLAQNPKYHGRSKDIDIKFHYVRDLVRNKEIDLVYCPSNDMLDDIFTKGLSAEKFSRLRSKLGVVSFEKHIQCEKEC
ncbi:Zinc finger CCHC-type [Trinorchestia longiramus]|nr:Zinc finger CCHC-type [Trinorchestia longiramus]